MSLTYETVIGLEVHIQLNTQTKAFCGDSAAFGGAANEHISPISLAHPGTLPRINKSQIQKAVQLGLSLGCTINRVNYFDRKNYFYADLPKGYQVTQDAAPICLGGQVEIVTDGQQKIVRLHHIHMEEDAGKSIHDLDDDFTLIDLNRAGVPLLEIVSEPDLRSAEEAAAFVNELRKLVRFIGVSDGNMEEGSMRFDCNVSVRQRGAVAFGNRCEVKNVNSIRNAKRAINFEVARQIDCLERGETVVQETRGFDAERGTTHSLRSKENAPDYRYFPEPDLPPVVLSEAYIEAVRRQLPILPNVLKKQLIEQWQLSAYDAAVLTEERALSDYFLATIQHTNNYKATANWLINTLKNYVNTQNLTFEELSISPENLAILIQLIDDNKVNQLAAKQQLLPLMLENPTVSPTVLAKANNLIQETDDDLVAKILDEVIAAHRDKFEELRKGKKKFMGLFVGEVMKLAKGKADPKVINALLQERIKRD